MAWSNTQIVDEIGALEFEYGIPAGEYLAIVKRESQNFQYQGKIHSDGVSKGLAGITDGAIEEYEQFTGNEFPDYMENTANLRVGAWYWGRRIPQMLRHYDKPVTLQNKVTAYNAGISYVVNDTPVSELPEITQDYIQYMKEIPRYSKMTSYLGIGVALALVAVGTGII